MSSQVSNYTSGGSYTYTAPSTLLNGTVIADVYGAPGLTPGGSNTDGGRVTGTISISPGGTLTIYVGDAAGNGYHPGGAGSAPSGGTGGHGGGSSAVLSGATVLLEAGGGGGSGQGTNHGAGGYGGLVPTAGHVGSGSGNTHGGGGGGGGHQGNGAAGGTAGTAAGGAIPGGGGQSGGSGGGGGAGGNSYASVMVAGFKFYDNWKPPLYGSVKMTVTVADPPLTPTLTAPAAGAYLDANVAGVTFTWKYNPGINSGTQTAYSLRISQDGAAYQYWNGTSLVGTQTWVTSTAQAATIPAAILADGHTYTWSIATQESHYGLQGPFDTDLAFNATAAPTTTITAPTGTINDAHPTVSWTNVLGSGDSQTAYRVVLYTQAATLASGFSPGTTPATFDSGTFAASNTSQTIGGILPQGNYVVYVQVTETGSIVGNWASSSFTLAYDAPAKPTLAATASTDPTTDAPMVNLLVTTYDNLLSTDDASFENSFGTWTPGPNTQSLSPTQNSLDDSEAVVLSSVAAGTISAQTSSSTYAVTGGVSYAAMAFFKAGSTGRSCTVGISWYTSGGTLISTSTSAAVTDTSSAWTEASLTAMSPGNAAFAQLVLTITSAGNPESHFVDECGLFVNTSVPAWSLGGLYGVETATINYSDDGGATWTAVRNGSGLLVPANTQQVSVNDYEAPLGVTRQYQAVLSANVTVPAAATVTNSSTVQSATLAGSQWVLTDPLDTSTVLFLSRVGTSGSLSQQFATSAASTNLQVPTSVEFDSAETMGVFYGWGNEYPIIQRGTILAKQFAIAALISGYQQYNTWQSLTGRLPMSDGTIRQHTLLLRSDMGDAWYVVVGPGAADQLLRSADRVTNPLWVVTLQCIVTTKP